MKNEVSKRIEMIKRGEVPKGYKLTKFGIQPNDWEEMVFSNLFREKSELTSDTDRYPLYSLTIEKGVTPKTDRYEREFLITKAGDIYKIVQYGDFVFNPMNARFGAIAYHKETFPVSVSGYYNTFGIINRYDPTYIKYFLLSERMLNHYNTRAIGSLIEKRRVHFSQFLEFKAPVPAAKEANEIGRFLSTWDRVIELKQKLLEQKKLQKKGLMERLLTGKIRMPGFKNPWVPVHLKDVFERVIRKNTSGGTNVLTVSAQRGFVRQDEFFSKSVASDVLDNYYLLRRGEFVYNKSYSNGYPVGAIKRLNKYDEAVVTTLYICFKLRTDGHSSDFWEQFFEAGMLNASLTGITAEGARAHGLLNIAQKEFFDIKVFVPSKQEQEAIAVMLRRFDDEIILLEKSIDALKLQKKGLMQLLLTGQVRVPLDKEVQ